MTRSVTRFAFIVACIFLICAACAALLKLLFDSDWIIGLGGALGAVTYRPIGQLFDRLWPALPAGWAK